MARSASLGVVSRQRHPKTGPLGAANAARRRERRVVGVGMGLLRHDGKIEGAVVEDDAVLVLGIRGRARYAQAHVPKRRSYHRVPRIVLSISRRPGCAREEQLRCKKIRLGGEGTLTKALN